MHPHAITVRLRWEGGHRLPQLPGKCTHLHGHSWNAWLTLSAPTLDGHGLVCDFSTAKTRIQDWIDTYLDHGMMLGATDPYSAHLAADDLKVYVFGRAPHTQDLTWPTVESVALLLARLAETILDDHAPQAHLERVVVTETENNTAEVRR